MHGLTLVLALATLPSQRVADAALADYMRALAVAQKRWARMAELTVDGKAAEAKALVQLLPAALTQDFAAFETGLADSQGVRRPTEPLAWAVWAQDRDQPALAVRLFQQTSAVGAVVNQDQRKSWFRACLEIGDLECVARLAPEVTMESTDRARVEALAAGTLAPPEALQVRARYGSYVSLSHTLALERWALLPQTTGDRIERLKVLASVLGPAGRRLAHEALIADPAVPDSDFGATIVSLVNNGAGPDEAFRYWDMLASEARMPDSERALALLKMGLIRQRQGRPAEAASVFRKALPLQGHGEVPLAALQIGHMHLQRGEYEAALAAYRKAESLLCDTEAGIRIRCGNDAPPRRWLVPYVLYQGICLERLGRIHEAIAEYASIVLDAPLWWRRPLALHLIELYDAQGRLDVLQRLLDGVDGSRYAETIPIRELMIVRRLEKDQDWHSLVAHLEAPRKHQRIVDPRVPDGRNMASAQTAAAHALARHCDDTLPLLPPPGDPRTWLSYIRALCDPEGDAMKIYALHEKNEISLPEVEFPRVTAVHLPDPIVCAVHQAPNARPALPKAPCP